MMRVPATRSDQLEAWVLSSYQRLERLRVPAFSTVDREIRRQEATVEQVRLRLLPMTGLPRELCALGSWLEGSRESSQGLDDRVRLSLFFKYLAAPLRYEPFSESSVHKATPSSRGRYPLQYFLLCSVAGGVRAYAYVPEFHALQELPAIQAPALEEGRSALVCVGKAWRYAEEYGEFAHVPCVLEAGHAYSQIHHLAEVLGIGDADDPDRELGRGFCAQPFEVPFYGVGLRLECDIDQLELHAARVGSPLPHDDMEERFPRLGLFQRCFDSGRSPPRMATSSASEGLTTGDRSRVGGRGVLEVMRNRTSGNNHVGVSAVLADVPVGTLASILATWRAIRGRRVRNAAEGMLEMSLAWLANEAGQEPGIYDVDGHSLPDGAWRGDLRDAVARMLPYANTKHNLSTHAAILIVQADSIDAIGRLGDAALREIHIAAGAAAQDFSIAASAHDMFARPVKMMREARLESEVALPSQVVYLVLCGYARSANPTMELF